ncbi:unnamed protein product [Ilex paraguariensis]|uniref:Uncharacterized protein n=1 Tax=Ilex paraguariensis TaxID=185542 RepID=A0ABC8R330_9AQUA
MVHSKRRKIENQYADEDIPHYGPDSSFFKMENHQVDGDVSIDKGKKVGLESDESDSEYQSDCESSEYDMLVESDYESEYDDMLYDSYVDNEAEWTDLNNNRQKETTTNKMQQLELSDTYGDSEEILSCYSSFDGENHARKHKKFEVFRTENDEKDPYFKLEGNQAERSQIGGNQAIVNQGGGSQLLLAKAEGIKLFLYIASRFNHWFTINY